MRLGKYFDDTEFFKPDTYKEMVSAAHQPGWHIDRELVERLDRIRDFFKSPVVIHRGFSTEQENLSAGSKSSKSFHQYGYAVDFHVVGRTSEAVTQFIKDTFTTGAYGMINAVSVHLDTRNAPLMEIKY